MGSIVTIMTSNCMKKNRKIYELKDLSLTQRGSFIIIPLKSFVICHDKRDRLGPVRSSYIIAPSVRSQQPSPRPHCPRHLHPRQHPSVL